MREKRQQKEFSWVVNSSAFVSCYVFCAWATSPSRAILPAVGMTAPMLCSDFTQHFSSFYCLPPWNFPLVTLWLRFHWVSFCHINNMPCFTHCIDNIWSLLLILRAPRWWRIHLPMQETQELRIQSPSQEDPLEEKMAIHFSIFAWTIPWTEEPGGLQSIGSQRVRHNWRTEHAHRLII